MKNPNQKATFFSQIQNNIHFALLIPFFLVASLGLAQVPGAVCETAIPITQLPYIITSNTEDFGNDYDETDIPPVSPDAIGSFSSLFLSGDDAVFTYTPLVDGMIDIKVFNHGIFAGVYVFTECPFVSTVGAHSESAEYTPLQINLLPVEAGTPYYIVISTFAPPQSTPFTLLINETGSDCPEQQANVGDPCDDGDENTLYDVILPNCSCTGIIPPNGTICEVPIEINSIPYFTTGNTNLYYNDYQPSDMPPLSDNAVGNPSPNYLTGKDVVYAYTAGITGSIDINVSGHSTWAGLFVFAGCPFATTLGGETGGLNDLDIQLPVQAGLTYYIVISNYALPTLQSTPYNLSIQNTAEYCPEYDAYIGTPCDDGNYTTFDDVINPDCECIGTFPPNGMKCNGPITFMTLPYTTTDNTAGYYDNYDFNDVPPLSNDAIGNPQPLFLNGNDVVYGFLPAQPGFIDIKVTDHDERTGLFVFKSCPFAQTIGGHTSPYESEVLTVEQLQVVPGNMYYIVISTFSDPQTTPYTLTVTETSFDCPDLLLNYGDLCDDGDPTTLNDVVGEDCICAGTTPDAGTICQVPLEITSLPYLTSDNTENYGDNYEPTDLAPLAQNAVGNPSANYLKGNDAVYSYTPSEDGYVDFSVTDHGTWTGLFVFTGCPFASTVGGHTSSSVDTDLEVHQFPVQAGITCYIVISTWASPQTTPYTLSVIQTVFDCPALEANIGQPCDDGNPATINDIISENCECVELPPAPGSFCSTAIPVFCEDIPKTYSSAASAASSSSQFCGMGDKGLWFSFTGTGYDITVTSSADFDHKMSVNWGVCDSLSPMICRDSGNIYTSETYTIASSWAGQMYYVYIAHYAEPSVITGNITINIDCEEAPACLPDLTLTVQDADGNAVDPCDLSVGQFFVLAAIANGTGNTMYQLTANDEAPVSVAPNGSVVFGPYTVGTNVFVTALGNQGAECTASEAVICAPLNDNCANATPLELGAEGIIGENRYATADGPEMYCAFSNDPVEADVWFSFVAPENGNLTIETFQAPDSYFADTQIQILDGCNGNILDCSEDEAGTLLSKIVLDCGEYTPGDTYLIQVDGYSISRYPFRISVTTDSVNCAPFDCPDLNAYFGDSCNDGNSNTINDLVTATCECTGIPNPDLYCADLDLFIGDPCDDDNENTSDDSINTDCECAGNPIPHCVNNLMVPATPKNLNTPDTLTLSTCQRFSQYSVITGVNAGYTYEFEGIENNAEADLAYITVRADSADGAVIGYGWSPLTVMAQSDENLFVHWNTDVNCGISFQCATTTAICVTCPTVEDCAGVPGGSTTAGDPCDDLDPTTYNDIYLEDCQCLGTLFDCPDLLSNVGAICNDENPLTHADKVNQDCECIGQLGFTCEASIPLDCNAGPITHSSLNSNALPPTTTGYDIGTGGLYFSFIGIEGDMTIHASADFYLAMVTGYGSCESINYTTGTGGGHSLSRHFNNIIPGETYHLYIAHYGTNGYARGDITVDLVCHQLPDNNDCQNATPIACGETIDGTTLGATPTELEIPECISYMPSDDVYYSLDVIQGGEYTVTVFDNSQDNTIDGYSGGVLLAYEGDCNDLTVNECSEEYPYQGENTITFTATATGVVTIRVYFYTYTGTTFTISATCNDNSPVFCPELNAYVGDFCNDGNPDTDTDFIDDNCTCTGFASSFCDFFQYYLADHDPATGISDIYNVNIENGVADLGYLASSDTEVHIAFRKDYNMIYAISKHGNSYRLLDPMTGIWGSEIMLGADYGEITAAAFAPNGKLVFASQDQNQIYSLNVNTNQVSTYDTYAPVTGGDIAFTSDGMLYMASRSGNALYEVWPADVMPDVLLGNLPPKVTGLAATFEDQLLISAQGMTSLELYNTDGSAAASYPLQLNGQPYTLRDGDLASECLFGYVIDDCENPIAFYVNHGTGVNGSDLYSIDFSEGNANLSYITNVNFEAHVGFNSQDRIMYFVNKDGSNIRVYDYLTGNFIGDLPILGDVDNITAVEYNAVDGLLYVGDANSDVIASIDLSTGIATYFANAPVYGGDLAFQNGILYLANRSTNLLYEVWPSGDVVTVGTIPGGVNGMAITVDPAHLITASVSDQAFVEINPYDGTSIATWPALLDGLPFSIQNGDMTSGCFYADEDPAPPANPFAGTPQSQLTAYPNPTTGQSEVVFTTAQTGHTHVEVYDMSGRNIATLFNSRADQDKEYRLSFDGTYLPNGIYIYRLTTQNETLIEKFVIAR